MKTWQYSVTTGKADAWSWLFDGQKYNAFSCALQQSLYAHRGRQKSCMGQSHLVYVARLKSFLPATGENMY